MPVKYGRAVASGARYSAMVLTPAQCPLAVIAPGRAWRRTACNRHLWPQPSGSSCSIWTGHACGSCGSAFAGRDAGQL